MRRLQGRELRRTSRWASFGLVGALALAACGSDDTGSTAPASAETATDGASAASASSVIPAFTAPLAAGGQIELTSLEGRDVVFWFWAPW